MVRRTGSGGCEVGAGEDDVAVAEGAEALDVVAVDGVAVGVEFVEGALGVDGVVEGDAVDDEAQSGELFFLALTVGLAQLAAAAVEDLAGQRMGAFAAVESGADPPANELR